MSVTNPDKVVTKQDLADFYNEIFPYLGGMPEMVANKFSKSDIYSTSEKIVGQWTDGKPVYQKVFNFGSLPNATTKSVAHGISNLDYVITLRGVAKRASDNMFFNFDRTIVTSTSDATTICVRGANIEVVSTTDRSTFSAYVIMQYTKTTDSATSIGNETDYSTTEKIVGTWIDSKPIYQKTIPITIPTCTTDGTEVSASFAIGASIDTVVDVNAWFVNGAKVSSIFTVTGASTKYVRILVQTNAYATAADRNKLRISNASKSASGCTGYATIQYTKTT